MTTEYAHAQMEQLYHFIEAYQLTHLRPPSYELMADEFHFSPATIEYWVRQMRRSGWLAREHGSKTFTMMGIRE